MRHGTVAVIAVLAARSAGARFQGRLRVAGRDFQASGTIQPGERDGALVEAWFDQGVVEYRRATGEEGAAFLAALGLERDALHPDHVVTVASPGRPRLMVPVINRRALAGIHPDQPSLAAASRRFAQLGCFVYVPPSETEFAAARMFAPFIGVAEDVANANSSGCLAAHLLITGRLPSVAVDQGDALARPSRVFATADRGPHGVIARVGGTARVLEPARVAVDDVQRRRARRDGTPPPGTLAAGNQRRDRKAGQPDMYVFRFHLGEASVQGTGWFEIRRGPAVLARLLCVVLHAPRGGAAVPIRVDVLRQAAGEVWTRVIGGRTYVSRQRRRAGLVQERIGPLELVFRITTDSDGLRYEQVSAAVRLGPLRLPIPRRLAPSVRADARARGQGAFFVRVDACGPGALPLFSYTGVVAEVTPW